MTIGLLAVLAVASAAPAAEARAACPPLGEVAGRSRHVIAFVHGDPVHPQVGACVRRTGRRITLPQGEETFGPPARAVSVAGWLVAYAYQYPDDGVESRNVTAIDVADLRHPRDPVRDGRWGLGMTRRAVKIGSLAVDTRRRLAWAECQDETDGDPTATAEPNCVHPGGPMQVLLTRPGRRDPTVLADATDIDPRSVRLTATRVVWTQGGRRRGHPLARPAAATFTPR